ncbi:MAG: Arc family DNA-binding protein [Arsenophonus sp.]|nr:Arc family DNA-binding protein [Arsenophonus sp.]MDR5616855.1 Arc family DNA-binding protein [Arsenophonus sp.]
MSKKYPSQEMDRFNIRMPAGMRDAIADIAEHNGRSMNTEIVMILQEAINRNKEVNCTNSGIPNIATDLLTEIKELKSIIIKQNKHSK